MIGPGILVANISPLIPGQFPKFYLDEQSLYVTFLQAYYEWMEQQGHPIYYTRNFLDLNDIDKTLQSFLVFFKEKYFVNVQLSTQADTRQLIKHAIDIYRSKGTERQIKLLFQLVFGEQVEFYYPKNDIFRLSSGVWTVPVYLELSLLDTNVLLTQKEIKGVNSGATAFIDSIIRKQDAGSALVDVAYISSIVGRFQTGEKIIPVDGSLNASFCPIISGSLTTVFVTSSGNSASYSVGDTVQITSNTGEAAIGRVAQTSITTGVLNFSLNDGGYGYSSNANCYVSNTILVVNNITITNSYAQRTFNLFETISEPMATINFINETAPTNFAAGDVLSAYSNSTTFAGNGNILTVSYSNTTAGTLLVSTNFGTLNANLLFNQGNVTAANLASTNGYTNSTATGMFIGQRNHILDFIAPSGDFISGEAIVQYIDNGPQYVGIATASIVSTSNVVISNTQGVFRSGFQIKGLQSGVTANVTNIQSTVGLINVSGTFNAIPGNYIIGQSTNSQITIATSGTSGSFGIANNLAFAETIPINTDFVSTYGTTNLNSTAFAFPGNATINATFGNVAGALTFVNTVIGQVQTILSFNQGSGYVLDSFNLIYESKTYPDEIFDNTLYFTGATKSFVIGEVITQTSTNGRAIIRSVNSSVIITENLRAQSNNQFVLTVNTATQIVGNTSGAVANLTDIEYNGWSRPEGVNANVAGQVSSSPGSITQVQVIQSGFDFIDSTSVVIGPAITGNGSGIAAGIGFLGMQGQGQGFYSQKGGFLSDVKKIFDGVFYQEFSYQVLSSQTLNKYEQMLKQLAHVAGIALFGEVIYKSTSNVRVISQPAQTSISIIDFTPGLDFSDVTGSDTMDGLVLDII